MQAMFVDFGYAENVSGECILRFDDTNPEAEKQEYIDHINDIVHWMGYKPSKVQHSVSCNRCFILCQNMLLCAPVVGRPPAYVLSCAGDTFCILLSGVV